MLKHNSNLKSTFSSKVNLGPLSLISPDSLTNPNPTPGSAAGDYDFLTGLGQVSVSPISPDSPIYPYPSPGSEAGVIIIIGDSAVFSSETTDMLLYPPERPIGPVVQDLLSTSLGRSTALSNPNETVSSGIIVCPHCDSAAINDIGPSSVSDSFLPVTNLAL